MNQCKRKCHSRKTATFGQAFTRDSGVIIFLFLCVERDAADSYADSEGGRGKLVETRNPAAPARKASMIPSAPTGQPEKLVPANVREDIVEIFGIHATSKRYSVGPSASLLDRAGVLAQHFCPSMIEGGQNRTSAEISVDSK